MYWQAKTPTMEIKTAKHTQKKKKKPGMKDANPPPLGPASCMSFKQHLCELACETHNTNTAAAAAAAAAFCFALFCKL